MRKVKSCVFCDIIQINNRRDELTNGDATISTKPSFIFEDVSDEDIDAILVGAFLDDQKQIVRSALGPETCG